MLRLFLTSLLGMVMLATGAAGLPAKRLPSARNLKINGLMTYDTHKDGNLFGLYSYYAATPGVRKLVTAMPFVTANGGAVYDQGKFYLFNYSIDYGYVNSAAYTVYDATTGAQLSQKSLGYDAHTVYLNAATAVAKDPKSGTVYACTYSYNAATQALGYVLAKWNLEGMSKDSIAPLATGMRVMAAAPDGTLYGITMKTQSGSQAGGRLVKIDTATGALTEIGATGVTPDYFQSAVIDKSTGVFYWFAVDANQNANLYTVDLATGKATLVGALPYADQVLAAYVPDPEAADGAPSPASQLKVAFAEGSLNGQVAFDVPVETYSGAQLEDSVDYYIVASGDTVATGSAAPGTHVSAAVKVAAPGVYKLEVSLANAAGSSPKTDTTLYIGHDTPLPIKAVTATREGTTNVLKWATPAGTVHGGYMNRSNLTYNIVRLPAGVEVATGVTDTTWSEVLDAEYIATCRYAVTPCNLNMAGTATTSNALKVGNYLALPYSEDFASQDGFDMFTVINANNDANTWAYYSGTARYRGSYTKAADDWLVVAPVKLLKGYSYDLSYDVYGSNARYANVLEVMMGTRPEAASMTTTLKAAASYSNVAASPATETVTLKPDTTGIYYIGFHVTSAKSQGNLMLDNVKISAPVSMEVPAAVQHLTVTPAPQGVLKASLQFESPATNAEGGSLTELKHFVITRNGQPIAQLDAASPQVAQYTYTDTAATSGFNVYTVAAANSYGTGEAVADTAYVGIDVPVAPQQLVLADNGDGTGRLSWTPVPSVGVNGGYVDSARVTYAIADIDGKPVATGVTGTSLALSSLYNGTPQQEASFTITAVSAAGTSAATSTGSLLLGQPYATPYTEGFASAQYSSGPWLSQTLVGKTYNARWTVRADQDQDGNGGSADFQGYQQGGMARFMGPKIDISSLARPVASLWVLYKDNGKSRVTLQVAVDNGPWQDVAQLAVPDTAQSWTQVVVDLSAFKSRNVRLGFLGECIEGYNFAYVDNLQVYDQVNTGVSPVATFGPKTVKGIYGIDGRRRSALDKGINIVTYTDGSAVKVVVK